MQKILPLFRDKKQKFISVFLLIALFLVPPLSNLFLPHANAGTFTNAKVQINNSQAAATAVTYESRFTTTVTTAIKQVNIKFCTQAGTSFADTCTAPSGMDASGATLSTDNIAGTGRTNTPGANTFQTVVTTPSTQSTQGVIYTITGVTNPSTINTSFYARIITYSDTGTTTIDYAVVGFAILNTNSLAVTATVDSLLSFSIAGVASGANLNGGTGNVTVTSTANTIPFGALTTGTQAIAAHDVTITTNATNGYTVTASQSATISGNPPLYSGSTNNIDAFSGTNASPTTWSAPAGSTANVNTGYFGYTTEDATLCVGTANRFTSGGPKWAGTTVTNAGATTQEVICNTAAISAETTRVGWDVEVNTLQPAGNYIGTMILIATPTY